MGKFYNILDEWEKKAVNVTGKGLPCGHYPAEEVPDQVFDAFMAFFTDD